MEPGAMIAIAFGLSLDACAVAVMNGTVIPESRVGHGFRIALFFGFFQMLMPILGWAAGMTFSAAIRNVDHWVAFGLLVLVGGRMIRSGLSDPVRAGRNDCPDGATADCRHLPTLLALSIATSVDALAVGLSFAMIEVAIMVPVLVIGLVTFGISLVGYFLGRKLGHRIDFPLEIAGGVVLVGIGARILFGHLA